MNYDKQIKLLNKDKATIKEDIFLNYEVFIKATLNSLKAIYNLVYNITLFLIMLLIKHIVKKREDNKVYEVKEKNFYKLIK